MNTHRRLSARIFHWCSLLCVMLSVVSYAQALRAEPAVVVSSIRPLGLMAQALAGDAVEVRVLGSAGASPHEFVLRPSERASIAAARLVLWMGPALERPLMPLLASDDTGTIALLDPGETDPHIWLDPRRAAGMARGVSAALVEQGLVAPQDAAVRLARFEDTLRAREAATAAALSPLADVPFVALHDGYRLFVARYGLRQVAALTGDHERQPGARSLLALRAAARESGARCLLHERGDNRALAENLVRDLGLTAVEVDPLARDAEDFDAFLARFASDVQRCLSAPSQTPGDRP